MKSPLPRTGNPKDRVTARLELEKAAILEKAGVLTVFTESHEESRQLVDSWVNRFTRIVATVPTP
jgi:hypothetical protein